MRRRAAVDVPVDSSSRQPAVPPFDSAPSSSSSSSSSEPTFYLPSGLTGGTGTGTRQSAGTFPEMCSHVDRVLHLAYIAGNHGCLPKGPRFAALARSPTIFAMPLNMLMALLPTLRDRPAFSLALSPCSRARSSKRMGTVLVSPCPVPTNEFAMPATSFAARLFRGAFDVVVLPRGPRFPASSSSSSPCASSTPPSLPSSWASSACGSFCLIAS